jgi:DNA-binding NarL/FixJ family response regulator
MRVLLADDQVWLRSALRLLLEYEVNIEVVGETGNIRTLPLIVSRLRPDLLFLEWQLPGLETYGTRLQFLTSVRAIDPHLYIIALTNDDNATSSLLLGANAFVNKAEPPERIHSVLRQAASRIVNLRGQVADGHPLR